MQFISFVEHIVLHGQKNTVVIYRLITCGSLEEKIYRPQVFKQAITQQTIGASENPIRCAILCLKDVVFPWL